MSTEELYKRYKTDLFSLAYRMLGSVMDAEDIVQDAFMSYDGLSDIGTFTGGQALNCIR